MRITSLLLLIGCLHLSAASLSQTVTIHFKEKQLKDVFKAIKKQTGYYVFYRDDLTGSEKLITIDADRMPLHEFLNRLLTPQSLTYTLDGTNILLREDENRKEQKTLSKESAGLQQRVITGKVIDEKNKPLEGVTISVKNTTVSAITDANGNFRIVLPPNEKALIFTAIGYKTMNESIENRNDLTVLMTAAISDLDEVVVVGYGEQKKADVTGSIATVKGKDLTVVSMGSTINTLVGKIPGVIARQTSGEPGRDAASLNIRGFGTPLIIIDGAQQTIETFDRLDANEIESVTVLKDASAAIYGARAGNGVILIKTRRGETGKTSFNLNSSYSLQQTTEYSKALTAGDYASLIVEREKNQDVPESNWTFSQEEINKYYDGTDPMYPNTDWHNVAIREFSPQQQHNLSMSGGNERIRYFGMLGYTSQDGYFRSGDNKFERYNIRSNVDAKITDNLAVSLDLSYMNRNLVVPGSSSAEIFYQNLYLTLPIYPAYYPDPTKMPVTGVSNGVNPIINSTIDLSGYQNERNSQYNLSGRITYDFPFVKGLSGNMFLNYNELNNRTKRWQKQLQLYTYDYERNVYTEAGKTPPTTLQQAYNLDNTITGQLSVNYNQKFGKHNVSGLALWEVIDESGESTSLLRTNYLTSTIDYIFAGGTLNQQMSGNGTEFGRMSVVTRINYDYDGKYLLQVSTRNDASPKFSPQNRWGFFPSISLGWNLSKESFLENTKAFDLLKIRTSISNTGYDNTGNFQYLTGYNFSGNYLFGGNAIPGIVSTGIANTNIFWEKMITYNVGLDFETLNHRLYGELDGFYRKRSGILATRIESLPNTFGATLPAENINSQNNRGFELKLGFKGRKDKFIYDIEGNISWARSKWDHYEEPNYTDADEIRVNKRSGQWTNIAYGYISDGLFTSQEEIDNYPLNIDNQGNSTVRIGDIKWVDVNGDGVLSWRDEAPIGLGVMPEIMFGLTSHLQYKSIDLYLLFQGATRSEVHLPMERFIGTLVSDALLKVNRWTPENNVANAEVPRQGGRNNYKQSDFWMRDASYVRLKNLNIGYSLPDRISNKVGLQKIRFYISGSNLFTFSKIDDFGYDPELAGGDASSNGGRAFYYPQQRIYSLGATLSF